MPDIQLETLSVYSHSTQKGSIPAQKMVFLTALPLTEFWTKNLHRGHTCCTGRADTARRRVGGRVVSRGGVVAVVAEPVVLPTSFFLPNPVFFLLGVSARDLSLYMCGELRRLWEGAHVILGDAGFRKANFLCPLIRKEVANLLLSSSMATRAWSSLLLSPGRSSSRCSRT